MIRTALAAVAALALGTPALAQEGPSEEAVATIMEVLAGMQCEMDPDDIELDGSGSELDDVFCADGQYDMVLDGDFTVVERRKE